MDTIRIIIAEDHAVVREGTRKILEQSPGLEVVGEADDGQQAVELVERLQPDMAIIDIAMPGLNGIEATRRIKQESPHVGVLVLTAYDDDQYVSALLDAGAAGYLLKNVHGSELVDAVRRVHSGEAVLHPVIARKVLERFVKAKAEADAGTALSAREIGVLRLAARGMGNKEIGVQLGLSARTVQVHLAHIFNKLSVASRTEAVIHGLRQGLLSLEDLG